MTKEKTLKSGGYFVVRAELDEFRLADASSPKLLIEMAKVQTLREVRHKAPKTCAACVFAKLEVKELRDYMRDSLVIEARATCSFEGPVCANEKIVIMGTPGTGESRFRDMYVGECETSQQPYLDVEAFQRHMESVREQTISSWTIADTKKPLSPPKKKNLDKPTTKSHLSGSW